ncbi:MAG: F0F1 ATP synthase subunit B [Lachnospiraceae bacterium]|nr:F0F1 ATP synthase subunit B [Lachnospiraceae bacterium]
MILLTAVETYSRLFGLDWQLLADATLTLIAVFILFLVMSYFLFNPAKKILEDRANRIKDELEQADKAKEEAEGLKAQYDEKLKKADREVEGIMSEARSRALANESQIIAEAKKEAGHIMDRAHTEAELEKQKVCDDVKKEIISVASVLAGKVVDSNIDTTIQEKLIDDTLKEIGDSTWQS